jgi:hypothetical protein
MLLERWKVIGDSWTAPVLGVPGDDGVSLVTFVIFCVKSGSYPRQSALLFVSVRGSLFLSFRGYS